MILFICWVVFILIVIGSVTVAAVLEKRARVAPVVEEPIDASYEDNEATDNGEVVEEFEAVEEFSEFPAAGGEPVDDFAAFDEEFK